jgi:hypothetical protein
VGSTARDMRIKYDLGAVPWFTIRMGGGWDTLYTVLENVWYGYG